MIGSNPTLDNNLYVCDVEARVFQDRIYLYGTYGKSDSEKDVFHVFSSTDMKNWTDHGIAFSANDIKWIKTEQIWAPDCVYRNGRYYLYYSIPTGEMGVAVSDSPYGPFDDLGRMKNVEGIDPSVLVDDDGQAYLYWGQFDNVRAAKLKDDMLTIDENTITQPLTVKEHEFHEGSSVRKINGKYYYVYTDTHRHGKATAQGYAVSEKPLTGFQYKNIIIDSFDCDPQSWNNHGCIQEFKGQWYIFYHRATHGIYGWGHPRQLCIEKISFNEDGTIGEVLPTSSGVVDGIIAAKIEGCKACAVFGGNYIAYDEESECHLALKNINPYCLAVYRYINFSGENKISLKMKGEGNCRVELYLDGKYYDFIAIELDHHFNIFEKKICSIVGKYTLELKFYGIFKNATLDEIVFNLQ